MKRAVLCLSALFLSAFLCGCHTTYSANRASARELAREGSLMFVRPDRYTLLGTRSVRDYIEIVYEREGTNRTGFTVVEVGLRNKGGQHWYDVKGPDVVLSAKATFYEDPITPKGPQGPPVYETNWQPVPIPRGDTAHYKAVCPVESGIYYQVTFSELIK